jgi:hypothetical protein
MPISASAMLSRRHVEVSNVIEAFRQHEPLCDLHIARRFWRRYETSVMLAASKDHSRKVKMKEHYRDEQSERLA